MNAQPAQQIPGVYHRKIGDIVVTAISDGYLDSTLDVMRNVDIDKARQILTDAFRPARRTSVNTFLIHSKGRPKTDEKPGFQTLAEIERKIARGPSTMRGRGTGACASTVPWTSRTGGRRRWR